MFVKWTQVLPLSLAVATACGGRPSPTPMAPSSENRPAPSAGAAAPSASGSTAPVASSESAGAGVGGEAPESAPVGEPKVTLLDPGKEPRRKVRYAFTTKPETLTIDIDMKMAMRMGERESPETELPTMRTVMKIVPRSVSPDGDLSYEGEVIRDEVLANGAIPAAARQKMEESLKTMRGMKVSSVVSSRGVVKDAAMQIPDDSAPEVRQALESTRDALRTMCAPLPEEPIGVGARWQTDMDVKTAFRLSQSTTVTLAKLEPDRMDLEAVLVQSAPPQPVSSPGVPAGTSVRLERLAGKGAGNLQVRLDHVTPVSNLSLDNETVMTVSVGGRSMPTGTRMHMVIRVKPAK